MKSTANGRRRMLVAAAATASTLLPSTPANAFMEWLAEKAAANRRKLYDHVTDKPLVDSMYVMVDQGKEERLVPELESAGYKYNELGTGMLTMERIMGNAGEMGEAVNRVNAYVPDLDTDPVSAIYTRVVKARGNVVKAYKPPMCGRLNGLFKQHMVFGPGRREWYDRDIPVIEWTQEGRVNSVLVHAFQASTSLGVFVTRHSTLYFGPPNARHVENSIRNSEFADYELRVL